MNPNLKQWIFNFFKYGILAFLALIIIINLYLGINKGISNNPVPKFLGISPLIVLSGSMQPAIMPGDVVVIKEQAPDQYKLGDVATYLEGNTAFTHRLVAEENGLFVLKGDNNNVADDTIAAEKLIGKVILRVPKLGLAILYFKTLPGMLVLLFLLVLCIYGEDLWEKMCRQNR